jgi:hypothetical protein
VHVVRVEIAGSYLQFVAPRRRYHPWRNAAVRGTTKRDVSVEETSPLAQVVSIAPFDNRKSLSERKPVPGTRSRITIAGPRKRGDAPRAGG